MFEEEVWELKYFVYFLYICSNSELDLLCASPVKKE